MHKIIDNALPQEEFENIKNFMLNPNFAWNLTPVVTNQKRNQRRNSINLSRDKVILINT